MTRESQVVPFPSGRKAGSCPICGAAVGQKFRPFCSSRCADVDLGRWLKGNYRIPTDEAPEPGDVRPEDQE